MSSHPVLLAEDDPLQRRSLRRMLESEMDVEIIEVENGSEALKRLRSNETPLGLVLLDLHMPVVDGMSVLRQARNLLPRLPCIVLTGSERIEDAVEAMQLGAIDFIPKPAQRERLITSVRNALSLSHLQEEVTRLQQDKAHYGFNEIIAISPGLKDLADLGQKAAASDIPVLITGESGVGKEVFAHALHQASPRGAKAFVAVNCGALPDNLVESTLFGHEKGAFTGAIARAIGKCREADGGTLFLDEVGELKPDTQVKLLRLLQQGEIEPVGSSKVLTVDTRIVSATNQPLEKLVAEGRFREDLYYRLQGLPLHIPPLRERKDDIAKLAKHLLERIVIAENRLSLRLSPAALAVLAGYNWPGNVRELQHILRRAVLLTETDMIEPGDLTRWFRTASLTSAASPRPLSPASAAPANGGAVALDDANGQPKSLGQLEQEIIDALMARYDSHIGKVAAALGIGQSTLYKRLQKTVPAQA